MFNYKQVTEGLLITVLGANFSTAVFSLLSNSYPTAGAFITRLDRSAGVVIAISGTVRKMECDELNDELLSAKGAGAGPAEGAPLAATSASGTSGGTTPTPDTPQGQEEERVQKHHQRSVHREREAMPGSMDRWSVGKHS